MNAVGEDHLVVGSDWGHHGGRGRGGDPSGQPEVFEGMRSRTDVPAALVTKMLSDNPRRLYGLGAERTPPLTASGATRSADPARTT